MRLHDYISCNDVEGEVEKITIRDTHVRQTDGQLVVLPNATLFKNPVVIRTDQALRRVAITVGVAYGEDVDQSREVIERALRPLGSVAADRPVQVFAEAFGASSIDFEVSWWTGSKPIDVRRSRDEVVAAIKRALDDAGIEIPFPYRTLTFKEPLSVTRDAEQVPSS
jgi:small-conductance mechanosensitive channel